MKHMHPLINPNSVHYIDNHGRNRIFDEEKHMSLCHMIGACIFNIRKYEARKDKKGQLKSDLLKIDTYQNYLDCLRKIEYEILIDGVYDPSRISVADAMSALNLSWDNWMEWKNDHN